MAALSSIHGIQLESEEATVYFKEDMEEENYTAF